MIEGECGEAASSAIGLEVDEGMATRPTGETEKWEIPFDRRIITLVEGCAGGTVHAAKQATNWRT